MINSIRFMFVCFVLILFTGWSISANADERLQIPPGTRSFDHSIWLSYKETKHFAMLIEKYMALPDGKVRFMWGAFFEGSAVVVGDDLLWEYEVSNKGHDKKLRPCGSVEVLSDYAGNVLEIKEISNNGECHSEAAFLRYKDFRFPFPPLPEEAIEMDRVLRAPRPQRDDGDDYDPKITGFDRRRVVRGILTRDNHDYLVVDDQGGMTAQVGDDEILSSVEGISLIDLESGFVIESVTKTSTMLPDAKEDNQSTSLGFLTAIQTRY